MVYFLSASVLMTAVVKHMTVISSGSFVEVTVNKDNSRNPGQTCSGGKSLHFCWPLLLPNPHNLKMFLDVCAGSESRRLCVNIDLSLKLNKQAWFISEGTRFTCLRKWKLTGLRFCSPKNSTNARHRRAG